MVPPRPDRDPGFLREFLAQELVAQLRVQALDETVLPGRTRFEEGGPFVDGSDPLPDGFGDALRIVCRFCWPASCSSGAVRR